MKELTLQSEKLILHPDKAIYWEREKILLIADLHLGKSAHFRRNGIPVPKGVQTKNLQILTALIQQFHPKRVLFLGDLFHSDHNNSWEAFKTCLQQFPNTSFELVIGNHDILSEDNYLEAGLTLHEEPYEIAPFLLSHHPYDEMREGYYNLYGHIHPCVYLNGRGRQSLRLPCFHFGKYHGILPAFGAFTGMAKVAVEESDRVFVIAESEVIEVN